ncbi:MAG TPA: hypothetical protein VF530_12480 [Planctomycetota bacterium]
MAEGASRGSFLARWERFWFGEASLVRLALFRIVMLAAAFDGVWVVRKAVFQHAAGLESEFAKAHWRPIYAFELLGLAPPDLATARVAWVVILAAIVLGILGVFTRAACAVAALGTFLWVGTEYSFGKPHHTCVALVFGLFALPLAPVGARLSLESWWRRRRAARAGGDPLAVPERAPWAALPLRLTQLTIACGYFFSGVTKLAISGLGWANGYTLMGIMVEYRSPWSHHFYASPPLLVLMSVGLLCGQIGFPLAFLGTFFRWVFVPIAVLFHVMAMKTMGTGTFLTLWLTLSSFVALERIPAVLMRLVGGGPVWRRVLVAGAFGTGAWLTLAIYVGNKPGWMAWLCLPVGIVLLLAALPRLLAPIELAYDPRSGAARAAAATLAALDWAHRLRLVPIGPGTGAPSVLALAARLPLGLVALPFLPALRGALAQPSPGISQPSRTGEER